MTLTSSEASLRMSSPRSAWDTFSKIRPTTESMSRSRVLRSPRDRNIVFNRFFISNLDQFTSKSVTDVNVGLVLEYKNYQNINTTNDSEGEKKKN
jgi:hypothetical protein